MKKFEQSESTMKEERLVMKNLREQKIGKENEQKIRDKWQKQQE